MSFAFFNGMSRGSFLHDRSSDSSMSVAYGNGSDTEKQFFLFTNFGDLVMVFNGSLSCDRTEGKRWNENAKMIQSPANC